MSVFALNCTIATVTKFFRQLIFRLSLESKSKRALKHFFKPFYQNSAIVKNGFSTFFLYLLNLLPCFPQFLHLTEKDFLRLSKFAEIFRGDVIAEVVPRHKFLSSSVNSTLYEWFSCISLSYIDSLLVYLEHWNSCI